MGIRERGEERGGGEQEEAREEGERSLWGKESSLIPPLYLLFVWMLSRDTGACCWSFGGLVKAHRAGSTQHGTAWYNRFMRWEGNKRMHAVSS